ncbi:phosphatase PAP2 family protein [Bacillaceae bacterium Marseille-Q3522]|nr:phosphatase PAP2 family protein [Bacillaceae bacterium Marseille-Q3522]
MERAKAWFLKQDESLFYKCNHLPKLYISILSFITHFGGARFTIGSQLLLLLLAPREWRLTVAAACLSLTVSHLLAVVLKRLFLRIRPYIALPDAIAYGYLFKDPSFPSGHSTAIFAVTVPYMIQDPFLFFMLLPLACLVAFSRVVLGVHYPSDVMTGAMLGILTGISFQLFL